jgi:proteasome lid subunit RPN8/RPN11
MRWLACVCVRCDAFIREAWRYRSASHPYLTKKQELTGLVGSFYFCPVGQRDLEKGFDLATVALSSDLRGRIFEQLQRTYPNEGGGFLLGELPHQQQDGIVVVRDVRPVENVFESEEQYHRYAMTPTDWMKLEDEADARGLTLVGYYHSHPDSPAIPSEYDRVHALPNFRYLITSVQQGKVAELRAWQLSGDRSRFDELTLRIDSV